MIKISNRNESTAITIFYHLLVVKSLRFLHSIFQKQIINRSVKNIFFASAPLFLFVVQLFININNCTTTKTSSRNSEEKGKTLEIISNPMESTQLEQISCNDSDCSIVYFNKLSDLDDKVGSLINKNAGKIFIDLYSHQYKLDSSELEDIVAYLREISNREGQIAIEPLYIKERGAGSDLPIIKDFGLLAFDIFSRVRNSIKYRNTDNYNAKVIFHPKTHNVLLIFLIHKSYGDVCNTIYSNCNEIEYLDDDTFDLSLSSALTKSKIDKKPIKVNFRQVNAKLFESKLDIDNFKQLNKSARLFKWFLFTKKTIKKPIKRERFLGLAEAITILDYSITLYDKYKQFKMYYPVRDREAEIYYTGKEDGGKIESVVFRLTE